MAENKSDTGNKVVLSVGSGIIGTAIGLAIRRAKAAPGTTDEALLNLLAAIGETVASINATENDILAAVQDISLPGPGGGDGGGIVPNTTGISSFRLVCVAPFPQPYQLPDYEVPDDMQLLLKGWPTNAGLIYIAGAQEEVIDIDQVWPLLPNEQVGYRVKNANCIWVSAVNAGDIVACTVEQRR